MNRDDETHLFVVRVWADRSDVVEDQQWRGKVQDILTTRGGYFENWQALVALLQSLLPDLEEGSAKQRAEEQNDS